jgi:hypothetical protein
VGDDSDVVLGKKFPGEKGNVLCHDATASSFFTKVWGNVFTHFHAIAVNRHSSMRN